MYYESSKGSIYFESHGPECAPAIVFCHGVAMDHQTFNEQVKALKDNYRVIVWDMPYHGKSSGLNDKLQFSTTVADIIIELLDNLNIQKTILVGLSLGSFVVQQAAHRHPERVFATVHISAGSIYPKYPSSYRIFKPFISPIINIYPNLYKSFAKHKSITPDTQSYLEITASKTGKKAIAHLTKEMLNDMVAGVSEPLKQPGLIVYGDHDLTFIKKMALKWHAGDSSSKLAMVENAHHIANQDNPEGFNKILLSFIKELGY